MEQKEVAKRPDVVWKGQWDLVVSKEVEEGRVVFYVGVAGFNTDEENNTDLCESFGDTFDEAVKAGIEVSALHIEEYLDEGKELTLNKYTAELKDNQSLIKVDICLYENIYTYDIVEVQS